MVSPSPTNPSVRLVDVYVGLLNKIQALMRKWGIRAVPNFRFFRNGELIHSHSGAKEAELRENFLLHYEQGPQAQ
jgi:thioredoxin 1